MDENVKIVINEVDNTSPAGRGTDSTDIAFIPGFSSLASAPKNDPRLCTSVKQFEELFGSKPRVLTTNDVVNYSHLGFGSSDFDRSYVFAKELLNRGMSVYYCNMSVNEQTQPLQVIDNGPFWDEPFSDLEKPSGKFDELAYSDLNGQFSFHLKRNDTADGLVNYPATAVMEGKFTVEANSIVPFDVLVSSKSASCEVVNCELTINIDDLTQKEQITVIQHSATCVEIQNNNASAVNIPYTLKIGTKTTMEWDPDDNRKNYIYIDVVTRTSLLLDAFYKQNANGKYNVSEMFELISDKSLYSVKYITSGGYPAVVDINGETNTMFALDMINAAATRGDAVALIDYQKAETTPVFGENSVYAKMQSAFRGVEKLSFGSAMYPWAIYNCANTLSFNGDTTIDMPGSFGYLSCVARAIKTSPNWLAMAGVSRGLVPGIVDLLTPGRVVSNKVAEEMQPKYGEAGVQDLSINCITNIRPYGLTLWGNRTMLPVDQGGAVALNFLNTRNMISDVKKLLYTTAKSLMFEQNTDTLWLKFKSGISPLLNQMKAGNGIGDYKLIRGTTKYNGDPLTKGEISAVIKIYPIYAVEYFELTVEISDNDVTVS